MGFCLPRKESDMSNVQKKFVLPILGICLSILGVFLTVSAFSDNGVSDSKNPSILTGEWRQTNSNGDGWMSASISADSIQVTLNGRDSSFIYWMGSFDGTHKPSGKFKTTSIPDADARYTMEKSLMASSDPEKIFTYDNGEISFEFTAMGRTKIVYLTKTSSK